MPGRNRPSFLKKQKEEQRRARAARKREERRVRKQTRVSSENTDEAVQEGSEPIGEEETS